MKKRPRGINKFATSIVANATSEEKSAPKPTGGKNPEAVPLGRLGGSKGGKATAAKLSAKKREETAQKSSSYRWNNK
jgi:hypothetical protein